jgi:hypothetical protein
MSAETVARWEGFIAKIKERFEQLMAEAREGCLGLLDLNGLDPQAMGNAWTGMTNQVHVLREKVEEIWRIKVEPSLEQAEAAADIVDRECDRGRDFADWMDRQCERTEVEIFAAAADHRLVAARKAMDKGFRCTQCSAELPIPEAFFRSVNVTCQYCSRVNTFEPGTQVRAVEHFCAHHLSRRAALGPWDELKDVERRRRKTRGDRIDILRAYGRANRDYWKAYYGARADLIPAYQQDLEADIDSRIRPFRDEMATNDVWRENS